MNEAAKYKFWQTTLLLAGLLGILSAMVFFSPLSNDFKAAAAGAMITAFTLIIQFLYRKGNPAEKPTVINPAGDLGVTGNVNNLPSNGSSGGSGITTARAPTPVIPEYPEVPYDEDWQGEELDPTPVPDNPTIPTPVATEAKITSDIDPEDATGLAMKFKNEMDYLWPYMGANQQKAYLNYAVDLAKKAWKAFIGVTTGGEPPTDYKVMEPESLYYANLKKACGDKWNPTATRGAIDILHDLLKFQATGMW